MLALRIVEPQRTGHGIEDRLRRPGQLPAFQATVVVHADAGEKGDLLTAEALHPALVTVRWQTDRFTEPGSP